jgi:tetratricopeptide (TPR) repeat protein
MRGAALEFDVKEAIEADLEAAHQFRPPLAREDVQHGFALPFNRYMRTLANDVSERGRLTADEEAILDYLCRHWPTGWKSAADLYTTAARPTDAIRCLSQYLGEFPDDWAAWTELGRLHAEKGALAMQGRVLVQGALSAHRASDRRLRLLEAGSRFLEIARKPRIYEVSKQRDLARQILDGLEIATVEYNEGEAARVVELMVVGQRLEDARKYLRQALDRRPSNFQLQALRRRIS